MIVNLDWSSKIENGPEPNLSLFLFLSKVRFLFAVHAETTVNNFTRSSWQVFLGSC